LALFAPLNKFPPLRLPVDSMSAELTVRVGNLPLCCLVRCSPTQRRAHSLILLILFLVRKDLSPPIVVFCPPPPPLKTPEVDERFYFFPEPESPFESPTPSTMILEVGSFPNILSDWYAPGIPRKIWAFPCSYSEFLPVDCFPNC